MWYNKIMPKLTGALQRKANKLVEEMSGKFYDAGEEPMKISAEMPAEKYYPSVHLKGKMFEGKKVGDECLIIAKGKVMSMQDHEDMGKSGTIEMREMIVIGDNEKNDDHGSEE